MKRALCLMLLAAFIFLSGCGTAPVRQEPEIPAKRPSANTSNRTSPTPSTPTTLER